MATSKNTGFTDEERTAMKERAREMKAEARANKGKADGEHDVLEKIAEMPETRARARRAAPRAHQSQRTPSSRRRHWCRISAYARGGKVVCFFQSAAKFKARYATLGFSDEARLDGGSMWPDRLCPDGMDGRMWRRRSGRSFGERTRSESSEIRCTQYTEFRAHSHDRHRDLEHYRPPLTGHCYRMLGSVLDAEDAVQEAMLRAWKTMDRFHERASMKTWLYRIATNVCLDTLASSSRQRIRPLDPGSLA